MAVPSAVAEPVLHPDRLLPPDPAVRTIARWIHYADLPVISPRANRAQAS